MTLVDDMFKKRPDKNPVCTAIETLKTPEDVLRFQTDYRAYMVSEGYTEEIADRNIGYLLGYYGEKEWDLWYGTLGIDHPVFGDKANLKAFPAGTFRVKEKLEG